MVHLAGLVALRWEGRRHIRQSVHIGLLWLGIVLRRRLFDDSDPCLTGLDFQRQADCFDHRLPVQLKHPWRRLPPLFG